VVREVNRYAATPVRLASPSLDNMRVSGYLATNNVPGFVSGLAAAAGLDAASDESGVVVSRRN
jgi:ferric-dicitrate binding protein FerR (iron transport regulator)